VRALRRFCRAWALSRALWLKAIVWRILALVLLCACAVAAARLVAVATGPNVEISIDSDRWELRFRIFPFCGLFVLSGVILGMRPPAARAPSLARPEWFSASLAILLGVGLLAGITDIPYLALVALEGLSIGQIHPVAARSGPGLAMRIDHALVPVTLALVATLATGVWIACDLRQATSAVSNRGMSGRGIVYRLSTLAAMVASAVYLLRSTIPAIHDSLSKGFVRVLGPEEVTTIVVGFAVLYAGVVARAIGRSGDVVDLNRRPPVDVWSRFSQLITVCTLIVLNSVWIGRALKRSGCLSALPSSKLTDVTFRAVTYWDTLWFEDLFTCWSLAACCPILAWAALETLRLCGPQAVDRMTAFDAVAASRASASRFLGLWLALVTLCVCALPAFFVAALAAYQFRVLYLG
jgi:hypothetical protein